MNVVRLLVQTAERLPHKTAMVYKSQPTSYQELKEQVFKMANGLKAQGIKEDMNVGLMLTNRPEYVISYFAILALGATAVPLNPQFKERELTYALNDSESVALIYDHLVSEIAANAKQDFVSAKKLIPFRGSTDSRCEWSKLLEHGSLSEPTSRYGEDTAQIIYTSGTTGRPKGAMITHDNVAWMTKTVSHVVNTQEEDRLLLVLPLFHAYAKITGLWCSIYKGATLFIEERFNADSILEIIERDQITNFSGVPTMYSMFLQSPKLRQFNYSSLRYFGSGGASLPVEIIERIKNEIGVEIVEGYGQTESTVMITCQPMYGEKVVGSVGHPVPGVDLRILSSDGQDVAQGEVGEIIFRGPNAMKGYYKKPEATAETIRDGWVFTGDLGYQDQTRNVFIVDRKKDMIIRGGYNVYPREIEEVLYAHPDVIECAVIGEKHPVFGEEIVAYMVVKNNLKEEDLSAYCKKNLANYKAPRVFRFMDSLPKTVTGKILKGPLRDLAEKYSLQSK